MLFGFLFAGTSTGDPSHRIRRIPVMKGLASHPVNGGHCLVSDVTHQYLAFYDGEHRMTLAKRRLGTASWDFVRLPEKVGWDSHNRILLFMDRKGHLHVTGNMHCAKLRYYRSREPGDIRSMEGIHRWTGRHEDRVTYPTLLALSDGSIHMMYRDGGSGDGRRILVHYDEARRIWTGTGDSFISGRERKPTCNAYPFGGIHEDDSGVLHMAWCWRETPDVVTNFDVCYARSADQGKTWTRSDGTKLELPIRPENAEVADRIPQKRGLMNGGTVVIDGAGRPYIGYTRFDEKDRNQLFVATLETGTWRVIRITDWQDTFRFEGRGTIPKSPAIPRLSLDGEEKLRVAYSRSGAKPPRGEYVIDRKALLAGEPGEAKPSKKRTGAPAGLSVRAVNRGPLPPGETHYMVQATDPPNRDRRPEHPRAPTLIEIVEVTR